MLGMHLVARWDHRHLIRLVSALVVGAGFAALTLATPAAAATIVVTKTADTNGTCTSNIDCSLREAIVKANTDVGDDTITFTIPPSDPNCVVMTGICTIKPTGASLPSLDGPVTINGWTQGGGGYPGPPLIKLEGSSAGPGVTGLTISATGTRVTVKGLIINRFDQIGIDIG